MKVLLVTSPHLNHSRFLTTADSPESAGPTQYAQSFAPMGLISLAGAVGPEATVQIADINKAINRAVLPMSSAFYDEAAQWLLSYDADLIGLMTEVDSYHHLLRICQQIKSRKPQTLTLLGGVHASAVHGETLRAFDCVDFVVRGEGEIAFPALIEALKTDKKLAEVSNLSYRERDEVISSPSVPLIDDLDSLPFPDFSYFDLAPEDVIYLEVGRGCPFKCNFCFTASYWQRKHRIKSPARILRELNSLKSTFNPTDFNFTHDLLTTDRRWVLDLCRELTAADLNVTWTCSSRTDTIDEEQIHWMKRAGCREIYFGVETGTAAMQAKIEKDLDLVEAARIIGETTRAGIGATVGFIAGLPNETSQSLRGTLKEAFRFLNDPANTVHVFGYYANSGSPSFENVRSRLVFDEYFVDFPLSDTVHAENCRLMESNFPLFTRYSRLASYDDLDVGTIRAADEFFPMVNPLRHLMLAIQKRGSDPLDVLTEWAKWIESRNRQQRPSPARRYQGTLADFLDFLELYLQTNQGLDDITSEMIRWERCKNVFRSQPRPPRPRAHVPDAYGDQIRFMNPSVIIERFDHAGEFLPEGGVSGPGFFAFYTRADGTPKIVRLEEIAVLILNLAKAGIDKSELLKEIISLAEAAGADSSSTETDWAALIEQLQDLDLLLPAYRHEPAEYANRIPPDIIPGYIPLLD